MTDIGYLRREEYLESLVFSKGEEVKKLKEALVACKLEVNKLRAALSGVLWMAEEWFEHGGDETTLADDFKKQIEAANAALEGE